MIKIEAKKLAEFISVGTLGGKFPTVVLNFKEDGVYIQSRDCEKTTMTLTSLSRDQFESYEKVEGLIGVKDSVIMVNILKTFNGVVYLNITNDLLSIYNGKKSASLKTAKIVGEVLFNYMPKVYDVFNKFDSGVNIDSEIFKTVLKNSKIIDSEHVSIIVSSGKLILETGDKLSDRVAEKMDCTYHDVLSEFNIELFRKGVNVLSGEIVLSIPGDNWPLMFSFSEGGISSKIIVSSNGKPSPVKKVETKTKTEVVEKEVETPKVTTETSIDDLVGIEDVDVGSIDVEMELEEEGGLL